MPYPGSTSAAGELVKYWTKIRAVNVSFYQSIYQETDYSAPYTPRTDTFDRTESFDGVAQNILGDGVDLYGLEHGSFGMDGPCWLGPMMTGAPFNFVARGTGSQVTDSNVIGESGTAPWFAFSGAFVRNKHSAWPYPTGINAPWYISCGSVASRIGQSTSEQTIEDGHLILPWSDFDRGGVFRHSWGWSATQDHGAGITSSQTVSGEWTVTLVV